MEASAAASVARIENTWIPLADGTRLAARIWMPEDAVAAPVPAVLEYLPYRKSDCTALDDLGRHPYFAARGYAGVRVDLRGTGDSDGLLRGEYLPQEQDDALEVLAWLERQPWCTGCVGMIGYSWGGFNGLQIAARRPPQLKAVITVASTDDRYLDDCHYMGGCLLASDMLKWATSMLGYAIQPPDRRYVGERWSRMWAERLESAPELARDWIAHQLRDDFWKHGSVAEDYGAIECPVMAVGGWADAYTNAVPRLLAGLRVPRLGLIGPWGHMLPHEGVPGPAIDFLSEAVRWWDRWLKGVDNGVMQEPLLRVWIQDHVPPATSYVERPGRWLGVSAWPPLEVEGTQFILTGDSRLARAKTRWAPRPSWPPGSGTPAVSIAGAQVCGETAGVWCANGYPDEIADDQRPDDERSLCFTTEPLEHPLEILGFPVVRLSLSADRPQALVAARLEDVAPDGSSLLVSWGLLNLTHRDGHEHAQPLQPGCAYDVGLQTRVCGHRFPAGHRVRLAVSPTYWPHAWPSPDPATLTIVLDGASTLELPVRSRAVGGGEGEVTSDRGYRGGDGDSGARGDCGDRAKPNAAAPRAAASEPGVAGPPGVAACPDLTAPPAAVQPVCFAAPDEPPSGLEGARHGERSRSVRVDAQTGRHEIVDHEVHEQIVPDSGVRYVEVRSDVYSITEGDPLSPTVRCTRETSSSGETGSWGVRLAAEMTCGAGDFYVTEEYAAFDGETEVFSATRSYTLRRNGV